MGELWGDMPTYWNKKNGFKLPFFIRIILLFLDKEFKKEVKFKIYIINKIKEKRYYKNNPGCGL
jgi:hypothetical protein